MRGVRGLQIWEDLRSRCFSRYARFAILLEAFYFCDLARFSRKCAACVSGRAFPAAELPGHVPKAAEGRAAVGKRSLRGARSWVWCVLSVCCCRCCWSRVVCGDGSGLARARYRRAVCCLRLGAGVSAGKMRILYVGLACCSLVCVVVACAFDSDRLSLVVVACSAFVGCSARGSIS